MFFNSYTDIYYCMGGRGY